MPYGVGRLIQVIDILIRILNNKVLRRRKVGLLAFSGCLHRVGFTI